MSDANTDDSTTNSGGRPLADSLNRRVMHLQELSRRALQAQFAAAARAGQVMTSPVASLSVEHTLQDAALLMSSQGVRHLPVTQAGRVVNVVSQRDLFGLQRLSIKHLGSGIRAAADAAALKPLAARIHDFARRLLGQGVQAHQLTELISHLNDLLTTGLVHLVAPQRGLDLQQAGWLSFGSEGRGEQTVSTDQDNGLVVAPQDPMPANDAERARWLALAREVNDSLNACGYLQATIHFDPRPLCGNAALAAPLQSFLATAPARVPRFIKLMADKALRYRPPLNWRGALATTAQQGRELLDLKLQGAALFVDAARVYALAHGLPAQLRAATPTPSTP